MSAAQDLLEGPIEFHRRRQPLHQSLFSRPRRVGEHPQHLRHSAKPTRIGPTASSTPTGSRWLTSVLSSRAVVARASKG
ncbi:hypothetical protein ACT18_18630 [Mycolicibacter kumamotonensis]|uniref:Uncharacterized protein n=1 Tax=Mycolicibacter kumamotonensis TaxID=354243 RepID=A0A1B8SBX4_9MYCO|nr:hypothetical protein ACT18_18630 [Mycolicibacter kumamotonensis]